MSTTSSAPVTYIRKSKLQLSMAFLGIALGVTIAWLPPMGGLSVKAMQALGLLAGAICFWIGKVWDDYVVALAMAVGWVVLDIVPLETAFATFHTKTWWLILGALGLGAGVAKSGLLRRGTLLMLQTLPATYLGQTLALLITGIMAAPAIPSLTAKVSITAKFIPELAAGMGLPRRSKASTGLFLAMYLGFVLSGPIFLTGSSTNMLLLELLPAQERAAMTWMGWCKATLVPGILILAASYVLLYVCLRPAQEAVADNSHIDEQLAALGPLCRQEKITLLVLLTAIVLWITEGWHGVNAAAVSLAGMVTLLATGVLDKECFHVDMGWPTLMFLGVILNLGTVFPALGIDAFLGQWISPLLAPLVPNRYVFLLVLMALTFVLRFLIVSVNALTTILLLVLIPVGQAAGLSVWVLGMTVQAIGHAVFVLPYQNATFAVALGMTEGKVAIPSITARASLLYVLLVAAAVLLCLPVWQSLHLVA